MRVHTWPVLAIWMVAAPVSAAEQAATLGAEILAFEGALQAEAVPGWTAQRATWVRLVSQTQSPQVLATAILTLEQSMGWEAVEATWKARRPGWASDVQRAASMASVAKLLLDLEGNTRWSAVREAWKKDRDGWTRRVGAIAATASAAVPPRAPTAGSGPAVPAAAGAIPLETVSDPEMGYRIPVPKGAKVLNKTRLQQTYSLLFAGGMNEINVSLAAVGEDSLAAAVRMVEMGGAEKILEKSDLGAGQYDVVALWGRGTPQVHAYRRKKGVSIRAKCQGPATHLDLLKEICRALEIVK